MLVARHGQTEFKELLDKIDDSYPFPFLEAYTSYVRENRREDVAVIFSDCGSISIPVLLFRKRIFRFAQLLYPPVRGGQRLTEPEEREFLQELVDFLRCARLCHRMVQPPTHCVFHAVPDGSVSCPFGSYVLNLGGMSEDNLLARMHSDHRREIRRAMQPDVRVEFGRDQLPEFFKLYAETQERGGLVHSTHEDILRFYKHFEKPLKMLCGVVYHRDCPIGGLLAPFTKYGAFYLLGGSADAMTIAGANKLLHWEAIRYLLHQGVARYDFVGARLSDVHGSKLEHIQRFKARFGGVLERGYLWKMDVVRPYAVAFDAYARIRRKLSRRKPGVGDIIDRERQKTLHAGDAG